MKAIVRSITDGADYETTIDTPLGDQQRGGRRQQQAASHEPHAGNA